MFVIITGLLLFILMFFHIISILLSFVCFLLLEGKVMARGSSPSNSLILNRPIIHRSEEVTRPDRFCDKCVTAVKVTISLIAGVIFIPVTPIFLLVRSIYMVTAFIASHCCCCCCCCIPILIPLKFACYMINWVIPCCGYGYTLKRMENLTGRKLPECVRLLLMVPLMSSAVQAFYATYDTLNGKEHEVHDRLNQEWIREIDAVVNIGNADADANANLNLHIQNLIQNNNR